MKPSRRSRLKRVASFAIAITLMTAFAKAQRPSFEVASVKRNTTGSAWPFPSRVRPQPGGRVEAVDIPLEGLIRFAYNVQPHQMLEGDARALAESFDVTAKAPEGGQPTRDVLRLMMRSLLEERFALRVRWEDREQTVLVMIRSRQDAELGSQLRPSKVDCAELMQPLEPAREDAARCSMGLINGRAHIVGQRMPALAMFLSMLLQRTVVDRSGLDGPYDFDLTTTHEDLPGPRGLPTSNASPGPGPSIYTALPEQLGLKLESRRLPVSVLVVEHIGALVEN
jgi:uncharacterized protein (TIGR03435 family)